jgi:hypothetical protein
MFILLICLLLPQLEDFLLKQVHLLFALPVRITVELL